MILIVAADGCRAVDSDCKADANDRLVKPALVAVFPHVVVSREATSEHFGVRRGHKIATFGRPMEGERPGRKVPTGAARAGNVRRGSAAFTAQSTRRRSRRYQFGLRKALIAVVVVVQGKNYLPLIAAAAHLVCRFTKLLHRRPLDAAT